MSSNTLPFPTSCLSDVLKALTISVRHAERQGQPNACPCYPILQFFLNHLQPYNWSSPSLSDIQCHGSPSDTASEWLLYGDSYLNTLEDPVFALDAGSSLISHGLSPMPDFNHQLPLLNTPLNPDNGMDPLYLSEPDHMEGFNFDLSPPVFHENFPPDPNMAPSMDVSSQTWDPYALPQSSDASSSNASLACDYALDDKQCYNCPDGPLFHDIQPCAQRSSNVYPSDFCGGVNLPSPTSTRSEEKGSECSSLMDVMDSPFCRWGGPCSSLLTVDKSEVAKHLHTDHGVKPGGDKDTMSCLWDGCGRVMKKESISRHILAIHLSDKTECTSCGKQFARLDSKLRHLKNSKRECRESESHDSRVKRRRLSWP